MTRSKQVSFRSYLALFPPGNIDENNYCSVCEEFGACRDWIEETADKIFVPVEYLAEMVYRGWINHTWSIEDVERECLD